MIMNVLFICVFFFEMLISTIFFSNISEKKKNFSIIMVSGILIFEIGALINIFIISTSWLNVLFSIIANIVLSIFFFKTKPLRAIFYSVVLVSISSFLEYIIIFIVSAYSSLYVVDYESETILLVIEIIISKVLYFFIVMILLHFIHKDDNIVKVPTAFYIFPLITLVSVICFWYISLNQYLEFENQIILGIVSILLLLATLFVFFSFQANAQKEHKLLLLQQEQDKIKTDITYYEILEKQNNDLRSYAHDAKKHLSTIKNLNNNSEIDIYISEMHESLSEYCKVSHSGNHTLDVVIDKYVTECDLNNIAFEFDIKNNNLSQVEPYDLVAILGNLLDNALEASEQSQDKMVSIETDFRNNFSVIIVSNSCDKNPQFNNSELPVTTKSNKQLHGFGLKSVRKTIKKYYGDIAFEYDDQKKTFIVTVMLTNRNNTIKNQF